MISGNATIAESAPQERSRALGYGMTFVGLAIISGAVAFIPHVAYVGLAATYLGLFLAYMGLRSDRQGGHLFEVIIPFSVLSFVYFGIGTAYLKFVPEALDFPELAPYLLPAQALATLAFGCVLIGYGWFFRKTEPSPLGRFVPNSPMVFVIPALLGAVGMSAHRFQLQSMMSSGGVSSSLSFVQQFGALFYFGWFLAWYMAWSRRMRAGVMAPILVVLSVMSMFVMYYTFGQKMQAVTILGLPAMAYYEVHRKVPKKTILAVVLVFVFLIFPMYNTYRQMDQSLDTGRRVDHAVDVAKTWNSNEYLDASLFAFLKRMTVVTSLAAIVSDTPRFVDYRYGDTLLLAPIGLLVPRFLWPQKPSISIGREFGSIFRLTHPLDLETETSPSTVGDFYWNFSIPGVVVGMWLVGMGYRWFYQRYGAGTGFDPIRKAVYATLLPTVLLFEDNVAIIVGVVVKVLVILVVFLVVCRRLGWLDERGSESAA